MAISKNDIDLIDKHLRSGLSEQERILFDERMKVSEFKEELAFRQDLTRASKKLGRRDLKKELQQLEQNRKPKKEAKTVSFKPWLLAAASVLLLVVVFWLFNSQQPNSAELFAQYYEPYPNVITPPIVKGEAPADDLAIAMQQYELKNYAKANELFNEFSSSDSLLFYRGVSAMSLNDFTSANALFKEVLTVENSSFSTPSLYYLGLSYLYLDERETAQNYFVKVSQATDNSKLAKQAKEILRKLE